MKDNFFGLKGHTVTHAQSLQPLLNLLEVAAILRVGKSSVYRRINNGELPSLHVGGRHLVSPDALRQYITRLERQGHDQTRQARG